MKKYILSLALLFVSSYCFSQKITSFSKDIDEFLVELDEYLSKNQNDETKEISKKVLKAFKKGEISLQHQSGIRDVCNIMLESKMKPSPYFTRFLGNMLQINKDIEYRSKLTSWLTVCENIILHSSSKKLLRYLDFTKPFLTTRYLRDSKSVRWLADCNDFDFNHDNGVPYIDFPSSFNLNCSNRNGSFTIYRTLGKYWIFNNRWEGVNGLLNWDNSNNIDSIYAHLSSYAIDVRKSEFEADSVSFYNKKLFLSPISGQIIHKAVSGNTSRFYPVFKSYRKDIVISNILPDVDYKGGYTLKGEKFIADGRKDASARIIINKDGKEILVANATRFSIQNSAIHSPSSSVRIYFDNDSIYHPSLEFTYNSSERKLKLYRDKKGIGGSPIYNSYHQLTIDAELLEWEIDQDMIHLGSLPVTSSSQIQFASLSNYNDQLYQSLRGADKENPLMLINRFISAHGVTEFKSTEFAAFAGYPDIQIQHYLMNLANQGFLFYDVAQHKAIIQQKFFHYINARLQLADYDVINFISKISNSSNNGMMINSSLNLLTKDLNIKGVKTVSLSDSQMVYIHPYNGNVIVKKNRDFDFSGRISAGRGRFVLYGKDFQFKYDDFKIDLNQIDSVQLAVPIIPIERDIYGNEKLVRIRTVIESVTGDLRIDDPKNKSGLRKKIFHHYPIFRSFDDSYVYYDNFSIFGGVYNRDIFAFHVDTFEIDSLENFNGKSLQFPGTFESAGIFPTLEDTLTMMDDYSLGFYSRSPIEGFDIYGGKAKYYNDISLSNEGLKGKGRLEYLTSITNSNEIYFLPDSMALFTDDILISKVESGIEFPQVRNGETFSLFQPYEDKYRIHKQKTGFDFYEGQSVFNGDIILRPTGLIGHSISNSNGYFIANMQLENSKMISDTFTFNANWFDADTADLVLLTADGEVSFRSNNVRTHIDIKERVGEFFSNGEGSYVEMPANQYICYIDKLHWDMDRELLTLGKNDINSIGSQFVSVHPKQDSLSFIAKNSTYDLKDNIINVFGVQELLVADAIIYPSKGFLIEKDAFIPTITEANILSNVNTRHHTFSDATVDISGNNRYTASGHYTYKDILDNEQYIFFKEISVDKEGNTVATSRVESDTPFKIGSKFEFKGSINLLSLDEHLTFNGYLKLNNQCNVSTSEWVGFESEINPKSITFQLDKVLKNDQEDELSTGLLMNADVTDMYTAFLSRKETPMDVEIITPGRYLSYDKLTSSFIMKGIDSLSNIFILNENTCDSRAEGDINLNMDLGQVKLKTLGFLDNDVKAGRTEIHMFLLLDFFFSKDALSVMAENIYEAYGEIEFKYDHLYERSLSRLVGEEKSTDLLIDIQAFDEFKKLPEELNRTISFTDITLVWDNQKEAYVNEGKIGIGNVYNRQLNTVMDGHIRLSKEDGEDVLTILLKTEFGDIYFFEYENNVMYSYSTNEEYNNILIETSAKKRRASESKGRSPYKYMYCDEDRMEDFERDIRQ